MRKYRGERKTKGYFERLHKAPFSFFHKSCMVFRVQIFYSLVGFIPRYLTVFGAVGNGINSLISFSVPPPLVLCLSKINKCKKKFFLNKKHY